MAVTKFAGINSAKVPGYPELTSGQSVDRLDLVMAVAAGTVQVLNDTASAVFLGVCDAAAGGTDEPEFPSIRRDVFFYTDATAALTDMGQTLYADGLGTIGLSSSNNVFVGRVVGVDVGVGWWVDPINIGSLTISAYFDKNLTVLTPATAGDSIQTDLATEAAVLNLDDNIISAVGTGTNIDIKLTPKGTGVIDLAGGSAPGIKTSVGTNTNINLNPKGSGVVTMTNGTLTGVPLLPYKVAGQGTTGTGGSIGQIACVGMTSAGVVLVTGAEAASLPAYVVAGTDLFTVYVAAGTGLDAKKVNYLVLSY